MRVCVCVNFCPFRAHVYNGSNMYGGDYSGQRSEQSSRPPVVPNNPYIALEGVWRDVKRAQSDDNRGLQASATATNTTATVLLSRPVSPMSPVDGATDRGDATVHQLNLSAICISNILMLEDKHLPSIFIRMYEYCLRQNDELPHDSENNARLRLLNYVIQRWHETRDRLTFYRDVFKVVGALAKPLIGDHLSVAVESTPINQQHVMRELMRTLRRDTDGRSLGVFLEQTAGRPSSNRSCFTFHDLALDLFTRDDVIDYESRRFGGNPVHSFLGEMLTHPMTVYVRRVLISIARAACRLRLNMSQTVSNKLFNESVPSWAEEDTENGIVSMDQRTRQRVIEARENITRLLMKRRERRLARHTAIRDRADDVSMAAAESNANSGDSSGTLDRFDPPNSYRHGHEDRTTRTVEQHDAIAEEATVPDDHEDVRTVDTESFLDTCTNYSAGPVVVPLRSTVTTTNDHRTVSQVSTGTSVAGTAIDGTTGMTSAGATIAGDKSSAAPVGPQATSSDAKGLSSAIDDVVISTERDLRSLIGSTLNRARLLDDTTVPTGVTDDIGHEGGPAAEDTLSDVLTDLPSDRLAGITVSSLTQVDGDIRMLSEYTEIAVDDPTTVKRAKRSNNVLVAPWGDKSSSIERPEPPIAVNSSTSVSLPSTAVMVNEQNVSTVHDTIAGDTDSRSIGRVGVISDSANVELDDDELNFDDLM